MTEDKAEFICKMSGTQIVVPAEIRNKYKLPREQGDTYLKVKFIGVVETEVKEKIVIPFMEEKRK